MSKVAIIAESSCNLPPELIEKYGVHIIPLRLTWRGESLRNGVDITPEEVYRRQETEDYTPKTSAINPGDLLELARSVHSHAESMVAIMLSSKLTSSVSAAQLVQDLDPELPLYIVDSRTAAMAQGFVVLEAARAAAAGASVEQVIARAEKIAGRVHLFAALETLKYLHRLGRVGASVALLGSALRIKPVVAVPPGSGTVVSQVRPRTWQKALGSLVESMAERVGERPVHAWVSHASRERPAKSVADKIRSRFDVRELIFNHLTPVMGAVAGPAVAVAFYADDEVKETVHDGG